jgi:hypothetical protein
MHKTNRVNIVTKETKNILSNPKLMQGIKKGDDEIRAGKGIPWEQVKKDLGWDVPTILT